MTQKNLFDDFTNLYELQKTLRFELKPIGKTADFLRENKVFEKDKLVDDHYHEIKYYFDALHREFIQEALQTVSFSPDEYQEYFNATKKLKLAKKEDKKQENKNLQKIEEKLRKTIVDQFNKTADDWKKQFAKEGIELKKDGVEILFEETILAALKEKFKNHLTGDPNAPDIMFTDPATGEKKNLFDSFKGFFTYFSNFNETKRNLYSDKEQDTAVANRAINENLRKFIENIFQFNEKKAHYLECGLTKKEQEAFDLDFYNRYLTQDGIDNYNRIIGGYVSETGEKIKGINEKINLYNQQNKDKKLRPFAQLYKQILSKKDKKERFAEITDDSKVFDALKEFIALSDKKLTEAEKLMNSFFHDGEKYDLEKIYVKGSALNTISQKWFNNWSVIVNLLQTDNKKKNKKYNDGNGEAIKLPDFVSIAQLKRALESWSHSETEEFIAAKDLFREKYQDIYEKSKNHFETFINIWQQEWRDCFEKNEKEEKGYKAAKTDVEAMMQKDKTYKKDDKQIEKIKSYCDATLAVFQMMKYFALEKGRKQVIPDAGIDNEFYNAFNAYYQDYPVPAYYNEFRNYLTKKAHLGRLLFPSLSEKPEQRHPFSKRRLDGAEKIKLNFENGMLLSGWDKNKENQYYGVLFQDGAKFLIGVMTKEHHDLFTDPQVFSDENSSNGFLKIEYRQLNNLFRQLPRIAFAKGNRNKYGITKELEKIREEYKKFQDARKTDKELQFDKKKLVKLIDMYKKVLQDTFSNDFDLTEVLIQKYDSLNDFFSTVERKTYSLKFIPAKRDYVEDVASKGKMFLFEIHNKDWNLKDGKEKKGTKNLHTLYFNALFFDVKNPENPVLKLSGGAEIFFRPKNENLSRKKDRTGRQVVDHKRYGEDKVFLHISIVLNMGAGGDFGFNGQVNKLIAEDKKERKIKIIGIDRGENNLAYFALIDQGSKLLNCGDLNGILPNGETYLQKLEAKAKSRQEERKEWKTIESIKELKNGYISWLVRYLADMMLNENAVLVFEDLNIGFKRGRQKIEQQVYQKLELALAQKLNYLVQKNAPEETPGHYLKAYQLTPQVATPQDIGKQCGAVFYVSPGYTSLTCPECGYRKNISFNFENIKKAREFIKKRDLSITFDGGIFKMSYKAFDDKDNFRGNYEVSSNVERVRWHKVGTEYAKENSENEGEEIIKNSKSGVVKKYNMTAVFKQLFDKNKIEYARQSLSAKELSVPESADYYRRLFWCLNLLFHSRNSVSGADKNGAPYAIDYIECPRCLFHSDKGFQGHKYNGDANGAYNIARKGLLVLRKIQNAPNPESVKWPDLKVNIDEWDKFVQK